MSRRDVAVHLLVVNMTTRQYGLHPTSDLLGVDYRYTVPADTEFPRTIARLDLFTRFYLHGAGPTELGVRVAWLDGPRRAQRRTALHGPFPLSFDPGATVRDHAFRVVNIHLSGPGLYEVRLLRRGASGWQAGRWVVLARTHFYVERSP